MHGRDERRPTFLVELRELRRRGELRSMQDVVAVAAPDAGDRPLVAQDRVHATVVRGRQQERIGLVAEHLGAELRQRPVVTRREHPPPRLALLAELFHQDRRTIVEAEPHDRASGLGRLRRRLDVDAAALGQVDQHPAPVFQLHHDVLPEARHASDDRAGEIRRARRDRLQRRELQEVGCAEHAVRGHLVQPLTERADLRELGHRVSPSTPRPRGRCRRTRRSDRRASGATRCRSAASTPGRSASRTGRRASTR